MSTLHSTVQPWLAHSQQRALDMWNEFETDVNRGASPGSSPLLTPASLLDPSKGSAPNAAVEGLFRFSARKHRNVEIAALQPGDLHQQSRNRKVGRAAAWLAVFPNRRKKLDVYIILDWNYLTIQYGRGVADMVRAVNHLVLHETGHVVLHWQKLTSAGGVPPQGLVQDMDPQAEAEAWGFCGALLSMALARIAYETKANPTPSSRQAWEYLFPHPKEHYHQPLPS